jgi:hypothetical protein
MNGDDLTVHQYRALGEQLDPFGRYICRLIKRMNKRNFPHDDALLRKVLAVSRELHDLTVHVHYKGCPPPSLAPLVPKDDGPSP